jgi:hypothetical protein
VRAGPETRPSVTTGPAVLAPRQLVAKWHCLAAGPPWTSLLSMTTPSGSTICTTLGDTTISTTPGGTRMRTAQSSVQTLTTAMTAGGQHGGKCGSNRLKQDYCQSSGCNLSDGAITHCCATHQEYRQHSLQMDTYKSHKPHVTAGSDMLNVACRWLLQWQQ